MVNQSPPNGYILGLDVGEKRIGVAIASVIARLPQPLEVIQADKDPIGAISRLVSAQDVNTVVVGLPRNLEGSETSQSQKIRDFAEKLQEKLEVPIVFVDESLSSVRADELTKDNNFKNVSQDSLAACFILEEYLHSIDTSGEIA